MRHAKIVATFGPATQGYETTSELIKAGVNVARLNFSHGEHAVHTSTFKTIRQASSDLDQPVAIFADLQGPKIRLGRFAVDPQRAARGAQQYRRLDRKSVV